MQIEDVIVIGAGPCGMAAAIALKNKGFNPLIIEKGNIVNTLYQFPIHQTYFSSSNKLEIGEVAFITQNLRPVRSESLVYYREVAIRKKLRINSFERVEEVNQTDNRFQLKTRTANEVVKTYEASNVVVATGYYDQPNYLHIPGEDLPHVTHYFKEGHPYYKKDVVVIGGKNSSVDAAIELHKAGANVTVIYRGDHYSKSIKPWILPSFDSLVQKEEVKMIFKSNITKITNDTVYYETAGKAHSLQADYVFAMIGYRPDIEFLSSMGIRIDAATGIPEHNEDTYETNVPGIYIAGVVAAGFNNNAVFIENGRFHGEKIAADLDNKTPS